MVPQLDHAAEAVRPTRSADRSMSIRSRASDWRMIRETCICETPMRSEISVCVRSSSKRRRRTSRSRSVSTSIAPSSSTRISARPSSGSAPPSESASVDVLAGRLLEATACAGRSALWIVARTSSNGASTASASSWTVGERPSSFVSSSRALATLICSSCRPRGTRTAHVLSRKWRLISPSTVGVAYDEKRTSRERSKPSIAFMIPTQATWTRSSSGSPRPA